MSMLSLLPMESEKGGAEAYWKQQNFPWNTYIHSAPPEEKLRFWHLFVIQLTQKYLTFPKCLWQCLPYSFGGSKWPNKGPKFRSCNVVFCLQSLTELFCVFKYLWPNSTIRIWHLWFAIFEYQKPNSSWIFFKARCRYENKGSNFPHLIWSLNLHTKFLGVESGNLHSLTSSFRTLTGNGLMFLIKCSLLFKR